MDIHGCACPFAAVQKQSKGYTLILGYLCQKYAISGSFSALGRILVWSHKRIRERIAFPRIWPHRSRVLLILFRIKGIDCLCRPMVPTDRRSSVSYPDCCFFTTWATSRVPVDQHLSGFRSPYLCSVLNSRSSCALSGFGNVFKESPMASLLLFYAVGRTAGASYIFSLFFSACGRSSYPSSLPSAGLWSFYLTGFSAFCLQRHKGYRLCTTYRPKSALFLL